MNLGFDVDEVVTMAMDRVSEVLAEEFGLHWDFWDFTTYEFEYTRFVEDTKHNVEVQKRLAEVVNSKEFQLKLTPYYEAKKAIQEYKRRGHRIHFITTRPKGEEETTCTWLLRNDIPFNSVHHVGFPGEKGFLGKQLNLDCFVDDHGKHLKSMMAYKKRWRKKLILLDRPWNKDFTGVEYKRAYSWSDVNRHLGIHRR